MSPDVKIEKNLKTNIENLLKKFKNFILVAPDYKKIYKNYSPVLNDNKFLKVNNYKLIKVKEIDWCFCILNKSKFKRFKILMKTIFYILKLLIYARSYF